jgi:plasmid stabilization system protein ParE
MVKKIIWTPRAEKSFDSVIAYLQEHWSEKEIINFVEKANAVIQHISRYPLSYRNAGKDDIREALITKQTLLLYRISAGTIYLLYFWDTRKNPLKKPI